MRALAHRVILAGGWPRAMWALGSGAFGALAMPPFGIWPALVASLTIAVWLLDGSAGGSRLATLRRAALLGWLWGFGYFVAGLWWIGAAFLVEADVFAWLLPFGVLGLPAILALFTGLGFAAARALWSPGAGRIFALALGLTLAEWLRGHLFTGFPWNTLGMALGQNVWLMQSAAWLGLYGMTVVAVLAFAAPATLATGETRAARIVPSAAAALTIALIATSGALRLPSGPTPTVPDVRLRIMQPNLSQDAKFRPADGPEILARYLALSDRATSPQTTGIGDVTHLVWPESAFPFLLHREAAALSQIARALPRGAVLLTGAARSDDALPGETGRRFYNAIQAVSDTGAIVATYDKIHLVPFGEYVPAFLDRALRALGIRQFVEIPGGFTAGRRRAPFEVPGLPPVAASICYEAIFPGEIAAAPGARPGLIVNVTNDGWFGDTPGPRQHFAQSRLRAVERGLPLVRAANTGISAVVDPYGRVVASLPVGVDGVLDSGLPKSGTPTVFDTYGDALMVALCLICCVGAVVGLLPRPFSWRGT